MGSSSSPMIRLDSVGKVFPGAPAPAVTSLSLEVLEGEFVALVGPSGCGKTTTLKMINRIIEPTSGTIEVGGRDILSIEPHLLRRSIGYVIQQIGLLPHRTVEENIATVPSLLGWDKGRIASRVGELVDLVGLEQEMRSRYPAELSGGQQQRVGVARALAADPPVLLMDEPFGAVDPIVRDRLQQEFKEVWSSLGKTVVFVTHDIDEAVKMGTRVAILNIGGILEQYDRPEEILANPASEFVARFLGEERGLRRLGLLSVSSAGLDRGPVVDVTTAPEQARAVMEQYAVDWVGLVDGTELLGWVPASEIGTTPLAALEPRPFLVTLHPTDSLRRALDAVVTSRTRVAAVVGEEGYMGMVDIDRVAEEITE